MYRKLAAMPKESIPRWVKVFGIITAAVIVLFVILQLFGGGHGPGRHSPDRHSSLPVVQAS